MRRYYKRKSREEYIPSRGLKASFTIEAAFVVSIVLLSIATGILYVYVRRDSTYLGYTGQCAAMDAAYTEEDWKPESSNMSEVEKRSDYRLHILGSLMSLSTEASRDALTGRATVTVGDRQYTGKISNTENYMRLTSVIADFGNGLKGDKDDD